MSSDFEVQTRDNNSALHFFPTVMQAMEFAQANPHVWKVSWFTQATDEHVRLVRRIDPADMTIFWVYEPLAHADSASEILQEGFDEL